MLLNEQKLPSKHLSTSLYLSVYSVVKVENACDSRTPSHVEGLPEFLVVCWLDIAKLSFSASPVFSSASLQSGPLQEYRPRASIAASVPSLPTEKVTALLRELIARTVKLSVLDDRVPEQRRLSGVLLDELRELKTVPLQLPVPCSPE